MPMAQRRTPSDGAADAVPTRSARDQLRTLAGYQLRRAQNRLFHDFSTRFASRSITSGQLSLLLMIAANPGVSQSALAHAVGIERSTLGEFVDRFEEQALVERRPSPDDRRSYALHLTARGEDFLEQLMPDVLAHEDAVLSPLTPHERRTLLELLARIAEPA